ncbi:MAG: CDP-archaeol synthase [Alteromonadaceae bacterium]|nr:CDP-archaeol synthase [Alteromonadaceae bacterium]
MLILLELFVLLVLANGTPVLVARLVGGRGAWPVDAGRLWQDGRPVFGRSKTWRGLFSGALVCGLFAGWTGLGAAFGVLFGVLSLTGDLLSSFVKRRLGLVASARARWLDQLPEGLLPMALAWYWLGISAWQALAVAVLFAMANIWVSPWLYRWGVRRQPH